MFRLKLGLCMHVLLGSKSVLEFLFSGFRCQRLFVWSETSGKLLFIRTILLKVGQDSDTVSGLQVSASLESELELDRSGEIQSLPHSD